MYDKLTVSLSPDLATATAQIGPTKIVFEPFEAFDAAYRIDRDLEVSPSGGSPSLAMAERMRAWLATKGFAVSNAQASVFYWLASRIFETVKKKEQDAISAAVTSLDSTASTPAAGTSGAFANTSTEPNSSAVTSG